MKYFDLNRRHGKPSKPTTLAVVNKFLKTGLYWTSVRQKTRGSTANIDAIRYAILKSPKSSIRRLSAEHIVQRSRVHNFLQKDFKKFPCKIQIKQKIKVVYNERESPFVIGYNWISDQIEQKPVFVNNMV